MADPLAPDAAPEKPADPGVRAALDAAWETTPDNQSEAPSPSDAPAGSASGSTPSRSAPSADDGRPPADAAGAPSKGPRKGPDGKFLPKDAAEVDAKPADKATKPQDSTAKQPEVSREATPAAEPPVKWEEADKAIFATMTPEQKNVVRRHVDAMEKAHTKRSMESAEFRRKAEPVMDLFKPYHEQIALSGMTEAQILQRWIAAESKLQNDPIGALQWLAKEYVGQDLPSIAAKIADATVPVDPTLKPVLDELNELKSWKQQIETQGQQQSEAQARQALASLENQIEAFVAETDEAGAPTHPYIQDVLEDMLAMSETANRLGQRPTLQQLYDRAVRANDSVYARMTDAQEASKAAEAEAKAKATAQRAMAAGSSVSGTSRPNGSHAPNRSLRDTLNAVATDLAPAWR